MLARSQIVRDVYHAFTAGDRAWIERAFAEQFSFSSPLDVGLDRAEYFERCWPGAGQGQHVEFIRIFESGDEVVVTYEMTRAGGNPGRNTEVFTFSGEKICAIEVYFGWVVPELKNAEA